MARQPSSRPERSGPPAGLPLHPPGPRLLATRSRLFADTIDVMGWNVSSSGFQLVMSRDVPKMADDHLGGEVDRFLADHGLTTADIATWVCHPGGPPKVLDAMSNAIAMPPDALRHSWQSMRDNGNISSASVLDVLDRTISAGPAAGSLADARDGPGFSFELLLLGW